MVLLKKYWGSSTIIEQRIECILFSKSYKLNLLKIIHILEPEGQFYLAGDHTTDNIPMLPCFCKHLNTKDYITCYIFDHNKDFELCFAKIKCIKQDLNIALV